MNTNYRCKYAFLALTTLVPKNILTWPDTKSDENGDLVLAACWGTMCGNPRPDFVVGRKSCASFEVWQGYDRIKKYKCDLTIKFEFQIFNDRYEVSKR